MVWGFFSLIYELVILKKSSVHIFSDLLLPTIVLHFGALSKLIKEHVIGPCHSRHSPPLS